MGEFEYLAGELDLAQPADARDVAHLRQALGPQVPEEYLAFLSSHDGAEGAVGRLQPAAEVARAEDAYPGLDHLEGLVVFGTNGGGEAFAFDEQARVVVVPWIGGREDAVPHGTFSEFVQRLIEGRMFERDW